LDALVADFVYPCAVRPVLSHVFARRFSGVKAFVARDPAHARALLERAAAADCELMLTEIVPGTG